MATAADDDGGWAVWHDETNDPEFFEVELHPNHVAPYVKMAIELTSSVCGDCQANPCECGAHICIIGNLRVEPIVVDAFLSSEPFFDCIPMNLALPLYCGGMVHPCKQPNIRLVNEVYQCLRSFLVHVDHRREVISKLLYFCSHGTEAAVPLMRGTKLGSNSTACLIRYRGAWVVGVENASNNAEYEVIKEADFSFNESEMMILSNRLDSYAAAREAGLTQFLQYVVLEGIEHGSMLSSFEVHYGLPFDDPLELEYRFRDEARSVKPSEDVGVVRRNLHPFDVRPKNFEVLRKIFPQDILTAMCLSQCQCISASGSHTFFQLVALQNPSTVGINVGWNLGLSVFRPMELKAAKCERFELVIAVQGGTDKILVRRDDPRYDTLPHYYPLNWKSVDAKGANIFRAEFGSAEPGIYTVTWCGITRYFEIADKFTSQPFGHTLFLPVVAFVRDSSVPFCRKPREAPLSIGVLERGKPGWVRRRLNALTRPVDPDLDRFFLNDRQGSPVLYDCSGVTYLGLAPLDDTRPFYEELTCSEVDPAICYAQQPDPWLAGYYPEVYPTDLLTGILSEAMDAGDLSPDIVRVQGRD